MINAILTHHFKYLRIKSVEDSNIVAPAGIFGIFYKNISGQGDMISDYRITKNITAGHHFKILP